MLKHRLDGQDLRAVSCASIAALAANLSLSDDLFQNLQSRGLQGAGPPSPEEPHTLFFIGAINDLYLIICRGVIKCAAAVLLNELEKCAAPGMVKKWEDFLSERFQLFDADRFDSLLDRFAPSVGDTFDVEIFGFHNLVSFEFLAGSETTLIVEAQREFGSMAASFSPPFWTSLIDWKVQRTYLVAFRRVGPH
jgi:hypothetical protein